MTSVECSGAAIAIDASNKGIDCGQSDVVNSSLVAHTIAKPTLRSRSRSAASRSPSLLRRIGASR
jgi:hypothetical protein